MLQEGRRDRWLADQLEKEDEVQGGGMFGVSLNGEYACDFAGF